MSYEGLLSRVSIPIGTISNCLILRYSNIYPCKGTYYGTLYKLRVFHSIRFT